MCACVCDVYVCSVVFACACVCVCRVVCVCVCVCVYFVAKAVPFRADCQVTGFLTALDDIEEKGEDSNSHRSSYSKK